MPGLLPIGRWVGDPKARAEVALAWNKATLPSTPGRSTSALLDAAAAGRAWRAGHRRASTRRTCRTRARALRALDQTPFIVSLELRASAVTDRADVVFPVAAVAEKAGTFVNWEGRGAHVRRGPQRARRPHRPVRARRDRRRDGRPPRAAERGRRARGAGRPRRLEGRPPGPARGAVAAPPARRGGTDHRLATWHQLVDAGRMQDGEPYLAATARPVGGPGLRRSPRPTRASPTATR